METLIITGFASSALVFGLLAFRAQTADRESLFWGLAIGCASGAFLEWLVF